MRTRCVALLFLSLAPITALAANRPESDYPISIHVVASTGENVESHCGKRLMRSSQGNTSA